MKKIQYVEQWTLSIKSDHDVLVVHNRIRKNKRSHWVNVLNVSVNLGGRFDATDLRKIITFCNEIGHPAALYFQEGSDQKWLRSYLQVKGFAFLASSLTGGDATPIAVEKPIRVKFARWRLLLKRLYVGRGAGPSMNKQKVWGRNRFVLEGCPFGGTSWHAIASQQNRLRFLAALRQARVLANALDRIQIAYFVVGDTNSDEDQPLAEWMERHGMVDNHDILGEVATLGNRSVDKVASSRELTRMSPPA